MGQDGRRRFLCISPALMPGGDGPGRLGLRPAFRRDQADAADEGAGVAMTHG
jgi:hypothetical protein